MCRRYPWKHTSSCTQSEQYFVGQKKIRGYVVRQERFYWPQLCQTFHLWYDLLQTPSSVWHGLLHTSSFASPRGRQQTGEKNEFIPLDFNGLVLYLIYLNGSLYWIFKKNVISDQSILPLLIIILTALSSSQEKAAQQNNHLISFLHLGKFICNRWAGKCFVLEDGQFVLSNNNNNNSLS